MESTTEQQSNIEPETTIINYTPTTVISINFGTYLFLLEHRPDLADEYIMKNSHEK